MWYRRSFVDRLREARPFQEIGLHGGLTHFIWTDGRATRDVVRWELAEGVKALGTGSGPSAFFFLWTGRGGVSHAASWVRHTLLPRPNSGIGLRIRAHPAGSALASPGRATSARALPWCGRKRLFQVCGTSPPRCSYTRSDHQGPEFLALPSRRERFRRGLEAAVRYRGIFHFCLHPENLAESPHGFSLLDDILDHLIQARDRGDVEILTMGQVAARMERALQEPLRDSVWDTPRIRRSRPAQENRGTSLEDPERKTTNATKKQSPHSRLPEAHRRF